MSAPLFFKGSQSMEFFERELYDNSFIDNFFILNKNPQYYGTYHFRSSSNESKSFILLP